jgi:hypothetical protein
MPLNPPTRPSEKQVAFAKSIAKTRGEQLPESVILDVNACSAYLNAYAPKNDQERTTSGSKAETKSSGVQEPVSEKQISLAKQIQKKLNDSIDERELESALSNKRTCSAFIQKHKINFQAKIALEEEQREIKCRDEFESAINSVDFITPDLREKVTLAETTEQKRDVVRSYKKQGRGHSRLDASKLNSIQEKLLGYWLEGLQSTAFDSLSKLDNLIGDPKGSFQLEEIETLLNDQKCHDISFDQPQMPIRHLVLKLEKEKSSDKKPLVISVLPLMAKPAPDDPKGYRWHPAVEKAPLFNRNLMGESTKCPGLMLDNEEQFNEWASKLEEQVDDVDDADASDQESLSEALIIWNEAFDVLSDSGFDGICGWANRFYKTRSEFWQIKKHKIVFTLVDGSAADGPSRQVCNVYRQLLVEPESISHPCMALFRRIADVFPSSKMRTSQLNRH